MLRFTAALVCLMSLGLSAAPALSADAACKQAVFDAFVKQRSSKAFSMVADMHGESGPVQITVEYVPPDRMHQTIVAKDQAPLETTLVGTRAWSRQGGAWEELMPAIAQTIIAQVRAAVIDPPQDVGDFACIGKASVDGKEYLAYRSIEKPGAVAKRGAARRCTVPSTSILRRGFPQSMSSWRRKRVRSRSSKVSTPTPRTSTSRRIRMRRS